MDSTGEEECIRTQNQYQKQNVSQEEERAAACLHAMQLANSLTLPVVLNTIVELGIFDIISKVGGEGDYLSAAEIVAYLPTENPKAALVLDRMLHLLSTFSLLSCGKSRYLGDGSVERVYSLAPAGKYFVKGEDDEAWVATAMFAHYNESFSLHGLKC
ncbi:hypothetical protein Ancab_034600 [Ancistrocladus abbreviatus]